jgi:hypothetical protein
MKVQPIDLHTAYYASAGAIVGLLDISPTDAALFVSGWKALVYVSPDLPWDNVNSAIDVAAFGAAYALARRSRDT